MTEEKLQGKRWRDACLLVQIGEFTLGAAHGASQPSWVCRQRVEMKQSCTTAASGLQHLNPQHITACTGSQIYTTAVLVIGM